ncbi:MAG: AtpZ/AtpI family protein [Candidatus Paceibacterota bacterium]
MPFIFACPVLNFYLRGIKIKIINLNFSTGMDGIENNQNNSGPWWKPGMQILSEVSTWIVVPIVLALIFGKMLDTHYGTKPIIFLVFAGLGFLVTCLGIFKAMKDYTKKLQKKEEEIKNKE